LLLEAHAASTREVLARRIIEMGKYGERDLQRLVEDAKAHLSPVHYYKRSTSSGGGRLTLAQ